MSKIKFGDLPIGAEFQHGKSFFVKCSDPFTGTSMGGVRRKSGRSYSWLAFDNSKLVEVDQ